MTRHAIALCLSFAGTLALSHTAIAAPPAVEGVAPGAGKRGTEFALSITGARLTDPQELMLYGTGVSVTKLEAKSENEVAVTLRAAADCKLGEHLARLRTKGGASAVFTFRVTALPVVEEAEPNNDAKTAQKVELNTTVAGTIEPADVDRFAVQLKKGQRLSAEVEAIRLGVELTDTALEIYGPGGTRLALVDDTPLFRQDPFASIVAPADGTYTVLVRETNFGGGDNNRYLLHVGTFPRPAAAFPLGGQAGTETRVTFAGGGVAALKLPATGAFEFFPSDEYGTAPTAHPFRVSPFPNVNEAEPNDDPAKANAAVAWPVAFNGVIEKPGDTDHFRFRAKKGDVIDVQTWAYRLGTSTDTVVAVFDARGTLVAQNDDDETHDSRVEVNIPADGEYVVRVTDKRKQGGPLFAYRVELTKPEPGLSVFLAEPLRKTQDKHVVTVPRGGRVRAFVAVRRDGFAGPVELAAGELPGGVKAQLGSVPEGEYFVPVVFEADANAPLGGKLVPITGTGRAGDRTVIGNFDQGVVLVRGPGDSALHAVALDKLAVVVVDASPLSVTVVPPAAPVAADGTIDVLVKIARAKGFEEAVEITFPALPPGVEAPTQVVIPADKTEAVVTLVASKDADLGDWKLLVEAGIARAGRDARDPNLVGMNGLGTGGPPMGRRPRKAIEGFTAVSSELVPVSTAAPPVSGTFAPVAAEQGQKVKVVCKFAAPLAANFAAKLDGLPPRATAQPLELKAGAKEAVFEVSVDPTSPVGTHDALILELAGAAGGRKVVYRVGRGAALKVDAPGAVKTDAAGRPLSPLEALRQQEMKK
jgi:hypothetical protein